MKEKKEKKTRKTRFNLNLITIGSILIIMIIFAFAVMQIGYYAFTSSFEKEYSESVLRTARLCVKTFDGDDFSEYLNYDQDTLESIYALGYYSDYEEYCNENGIEVDDDLYLAASMYSVTEETLNEVCNTMGMAVIYIIIPDDDYKNYTCVYNCVSETSGYDPWELGRRVETPSSYYDAYKSIMYIYEQNPLIWMPMDSVTNAIAVSFLEKGVEMNDERAWKEKYIRDMRGW